MSEPASSDGAGGEPLAFPMARTCPFAPPPDYTRMRDTGPLVRVQLPTGKQAWAVTSYEHVRAVLAHPALSADARRPGFPALVPGEQEVASRTRPFIRMDPPEHTRLRRMLLTHLTAHRAREMRRTVQRVVDDRVDELLAHGPPADLLTQFAHTVSSTVMCELIGVRRGDAWFGRVTGAMGSQVVGGATSTEAGANAGLDALFAVLEAVLAERERSPGADLLGRLVTKQLRPGHASREEIVTTVAITLIAGRETTTNQIALGALVLMEDADLLTRLRADHTLWPRVVDELLRVASVGDSIPLRVATRDIEVGGQVLPAGHGVIPLLAAADHDPAAFSDPSRVDPERPARPHLAFGYGVHQCVGHNLARLELETALSTLFDRIPGLRLACAVGDLRYRQHGISFGPDSLPVRW